MEEYRRCENNIKTDPNEIGVDLKNRLEFAQDRDHREK